MLEDARQAGAVEETTADAVRVIKPGSGLVLGLVDGPGSATALVWPGMGARYRSLHRFVLGPDARTVAQEHDGEAVYGVLSGETRIIDLASGEQAELGTGAMVHLDPGTPYCFVAGSDGAVFIGGPCPPDETLYADTTPAAS